MTREEDSGQGIDAPRETDRVYFYIFGLTQDFRRIMQIFCDKFSTVDTKIADMFTQLAVKRSNRPVRDTVIRRGASQVVVQYHSGHVSDPDYRLNLKYSNMNNIFHRYFLPTQTNKSKPYCCISNFKGRLSLSIN